MDDMKWCYQCKQWKPKSEFYTNRHKKDGIATPCKVCSKANCRAYNHSERGEMIKKFYNSLPKTKECKRRYEDSEAGKQSKAKNLDKFPERRKARRKISNAIRDGKFPRANTRKCACGKQAAEYHHHLGYAPEYWLDVIPVCVECHRNADKVKDRSVAGSYLAK